MAFSNYIQFGTSGKFKPTENGNLSLAFNDYYYNENVGEYNISIYHSGNLVTQKSILGGYNNWQPVIGLEGGKTYNYIASGLVSTLEKPDGWSPDGWIGNIARDVNGGNGTRVVKHFDFSDYGTWKSYFKTVIPNPYEGAPCDVYFSSLALGGTLMVGKALDIYTYSYWGPRYYMRDAPPGVLELPGMGSIYSNYSSDPGANGVYQKPYSKPIALGIGESIEFYMVNGPSPLDNSSPSWVGGTLDVVFFNDTSNFLAPLQTAFSLVGKYDSLSSPSICLSIAVFNQQDTGQNPSNTGSGYNPPNVDIEIPDNTTFNSGVLSLEINGEGDSCYSGEFYNKITEFKINSYYNETELNIDFDFVEENTSFSKYLSYTEDNPILSYKTGYSGISGNTTNTIQTGYLYGPTTGFVNTDITGLNGQVQQCLSTGFSGSGIIGTGIINIYFNQVVSGLVSSGSGYYQIIPYVYQSGTGVISERVSGFNPQVKILQDGNLIDYNDDWKQNIYYNYISGKVTGLSDIQSSNLFDIVGGNNFSVNVSPSPNNNSDGYIRKNSSTLKLLEDKNYVYNSYFSPLAAWASYDVRSGTNSKNVIGYAVEIVNDVILSGSEIYSTGFKINPPTIQTSGTDIRTEYIAYCINLEDKECDKEINDVTVCYTGEINTPEYNAFITGVTAKFANKFDPEINGTDQGSISSGIIPSYFKYFSGELTYNTFNSGDSFNFDLYPFNYTGLYQQYFLTNPSTPSTGLKLVYPTDFTNITGLVSKINSKLSGINMPVWYPYDCISGAGQQGIYVNGGLLKATVKNLPTGDINYNNIIVLESLRNNTGFNLTLNIAPRPIVKETSKTQLKYLIPSYLRLEGSNNNSSWTTIDIQSGINWTGLSPIEKNLTGLQSGIPKNINIVTFPKDEEFFDISTTGKGGYETIYSFIQSGRVSPGENCSTISFERAIDIVRPTGYPPNTIFDPKTCMPAESGSQEDASNEDSNPPASGQPGSSTNPLYKTSYLRTGFILNSSTGVTYDYYRVYLSGFNGDGKNYESLSNTFIVKNINLYSSESVNIPVHSGQSLCAIGSDYSLKVQGYVPVILTGMLDMYMTQDDKGVFIFNNQLVTMKVSGLQSGDYVRFNRESGRLISNSGQGFLTDNLTGTGCFTTGITDWFYDTGSKQITFEKLFTGCFSGSGQLSGNYTRLKPSFVNQQLAQGGFLNGVFNVSVTTGVQFTGLTIANIFAQNLTGIYNYTGTITGYAESGYFAFNSGISLVLNYPTESDNIAAGATGYKNATAYLNYGIPEQFDLLSINGKTISYNFDSGSFPAPDFYFSSGNLIDTINSNPFTFYSNASVENGLIKLTSLLSGNDGNLISLASSRGTNTGN